MTTAERAPHHDHAPAAARTDPERLFQAALPFIVKLANRRGFGAQGQQDIAQDVAVALVEKIDTYDPRLGTEVGWVIGIARNVIRCARRSERTERRFIQEEPTAGLDSQPAPDLTPEEHARAHTVLAQLNTALTEQQRAVYELTVEGYTAADAGAILGLPATTVELRLKEARVRLAGVLRRIGENEKTVTRVRGAAAPLFCIETIPRVLQSRAWRRAVRWLSAPWPRARIAVAALASLAALLAGRGEDGSSDTRPPASASTRLDPHEVAHAPPSGGPSDRPANRATKASAPPAAAALPSSPGAAAPAARQATTRPAETATSSHSSRAGGPAPTRSRGDWLLQRTLSASPASAVALAKVHAERSPHHNVDRRDLLLVRALMALGRRDEAAMHAHKLRGTPYEEQALAEVAAPRR